MMMLLLTIIAINLVTFATSQQDLPVSPTDAGGQPIFTFDENQQQQFVSDNMLGVDPMMIGNNNGRKKCQAGQVFCFEQMTCVSLSKNANKRRRLTMMAEIDEIGVMGLAHRTCKASEIYCIETGRCRPRVNSAASVVVSAGGTVRSLAIASNRASTSSSGSNKQAANALKKRRVKVAGNATFLADFYLVVADSSKMEAFKLSFVRGLSGYLQIPSSSVVVLGLYPGSIVVAFSATQNSTASTTDDSTLIKSFQQDVANGLDSMYVDNGEDVVLSVSNYRLNAGVEDGGFDYVPNNGTYSTTTLSTVQEVLEIIKQIWFWVVIGIVGLIVILVCVVGIYCHCKKKKQAMMKISPMMMNNAMMMHNYAMVNQQQHHHQSPPPPYPIDDHRGGPAQPYHQQPGMDNRQRTDMVPDDDVIYGNAGKQALSLRPEMATTFRPGPSTSARSIAQTP